LANLNRLGLFEMQIKDLLATLALPGVVLSAAFPPTQDPEIPYQDEGFHIVGGVAAAPGDFPYIVSVQERGLHNCGGSLLNANTVLTAAHCAYKRLASDLRIRAGSLVS
jgi:trypsin